MTKLEVKEMIVWVPSKSVNIDGYLPDLCVDKTRDEEHESELY